MKSFHFIITFDYPTNQGYLNNNNNNNNSSFNQTSYDIKPSGEFLRPSRNPSDLTEWDYEFLKSQTGFFFFLSSNVYSNKKN